MPFWKNESKNYYDQRTNNISESLTEQLYCLKDTFTEVLHSVCRAIEKDCGDIDNDEKVKELARIKQKYSNLREEVCRIISEFTLASPVTKEETQAVQEGLKQCMSYLNRVHHSMESILKKYEDDSGNQCCEKDSPHLHKDIDGNHLIIELKKGTQSEMDYVSQLIQNVNGLSEENKKKIFNKIHHLSESEEEVGAGDISRHICTETENNLAANKLIQEKIDVNVKQNSPRSFFENPISEINRPLSSSCHIITQTSNINTQLRQENYQNWYFPEKIIESLLAGYNWSNCSNEIKSELNKQYLYEINETETVKKSLKIIEPNKTILTSNGNHNLRLPVQNIKENSVPILHIYDSKGNPLTDPNGIPLKNISGELLVKFQNKKPISTSNGEPIFDSNGLPFVISFEKPLFNVYQKPLRLYNQDGIPLINENGHILKLFNGKFAIILDQYNRLMSDACGRPLYDENGNQITHPFTDYVQEQPKIVTNEQPMLYNEKGFLLTTASGKPLNDIHGNPVVTNDEISGALVDRAGNPVYDSEGNIYCRSMRRIFQLYDCNKYPLTSGDGNILRNVEGKELVIFDHRNNPVRDCMDRLIYDAAGHSSDTLKFNPYLQVANKCKNTILNIGQQVFDFRGYPLLDFDNSSLVTFDGKELIVCDDNGKILHDINGNPIFDKAGIPLTKINDCWTTPKGHPYRVFDPKGFPLTSVRGEDLFDINGDSLLKLDKLGRPTETTRGMPVCDANGYPTTHSEFNPSQGPNIRGTVRQVYFQNKPLKIYNQNGMPLLDATGTAMTNSKGTILIRYDRNGIPITDFNGNKIFDEYKIPFNCQKNEPIITMSGKPMRIYDQRGRSLTDTNGVPLTLANGSCLIKFDNAGRPISDFRDSDLYDCNGRKINDAQANTELFREKEHVKLMKKDGKPIVVYNREGMPLTDRNGILLVNADGTHLCLNKDKYPLSDYNGDPIYDENGKPFITSVIANEEILEHTDPFGRLLKDGCGESQFDIYGRPLFDLYRRKLYDEQGRPIANAFSRYLINGMPEPKEIELGFDPIVLNFPANMEIQLPTDLIGSPIFDCLGMPLYNQYGKPLIDRYGRPLYDKNGMPLCDLETGIPVSTSVRQNGIPVQVKDVYKLIEVTKDVANLIDDTVLRSKTAEHNAYVPGIWVLPPESEKDDKICPTHPDKTMYWALLRMTTFEDGKKSFEILQAKPCNGEIKKDYLSE